MAKTSSFFYSNPFAFATETPAKPITTFIANESAGNCQKLVEYLVNKYGIQVPEEFSKQLNKAHFEFRTSQFYMPFNTVDGIIKSCSMWKPYIAEEDFDKLVCGELISMARIHTSVLAARNFEEQQNLRFTNQPDYLFVTIVDYAGAVKVYH